MTHRILFTEPSTLVKKRGAVFKVGDVFYKKLLRPPKVVETKDGSGNAYVFGPKFSLRTYICIGGHSNDVAETGLIDLDIYNRETQSGAGPIIEVLYTNENIRRDDADTLRKLRVSVPHIIFLGETVGGDVGAYLYAHFTRGKIDSLIIDNNCYFEPS